MIETNAASGNLLIWRSIRSCIACDCASAVLGARRTSMTMFFLSSVGANSCPRWPKRSTAQTNSSAAPASTGSGLAIDVRSNGAYTDFRRRTIRLSSSRTGFRIVIAMAAGTNVRETTNAIASAIMTVSAIGSNVLPSKPVMASRGTYTRKAAGLPIEAAA